MNLYNLLFGLFLSIVSFWLFVREMTKSKKPIDGYKIRIIKNSATHEKTF